MTGEVRLPAGYRLLRHGEVDSTSDHAKRLAEAGAATGADIPIPHAANLGRPTVPATDEVVEALRGVCYS